MTSLELLQEIDAWLSFNNSPSKEQINELQNDIKKHIGDQSNLPPVSGSSDTKWKEAYKECFELFIPTDKWDEATEFLSTYGSGLAKDIARKEK